jgi:hypothetical protein
MIEAETLHIPVTSGVIIATLKQRLRLAEVKCIGRPLLQAISRNLAVIVLRPGLRPGLRLWFAGMKLKNTWKDIYNDQAAKMSLV